MSNHLHIVCFRCNSTNRIPESRITHNPKCGKCKSFLFSAHPIELTSENFNIHINNNHIPVVVDFWAAWCGPCKIMAPVFEEAAARLEARVRFAKVNTEVEQGLASQFNIRSIPTMILFKEGREKGRQAGAMDLSNLLRWVESLS